MSAPAVATLPPTVVAAFGDESRRRLGILLLAQSIQAGLRLQDGIKYEPHRPEDLPDLPEAVRLRVRLRQELRQFLDLVAEYPSVSESAWTDWAALAADPTLWCDPLLSAEWAAHLLPASFDARFTVAINQLRIGRARPALHRLQEIQNHLPRRREPRARVLRNLAAAYEVLGDPEGARWSAEQSFRACPWEAANLTSFVIYLALDEQRGDHVETVRSACASRGAELDRHALWQLLDQGAGPASAALRSDPIIHQRFRRAVLAPL